MRRLSKIAQTPGVGAPNVPGGGGGGSLGGSATMPKMAPNVNRRNAVNAPMRTPTAAMAPTMPKTASFTAVLEKLAKGISFKKTYDPSSLALPEAKGGKYKADTLGAEKLKQGTFRTMVKESDVGKTPKKSINIYGDSNKPAPPLPKQEFGKKPEPTVYPKGNSGLGFAISEIKKKKGL